MLAVASESLYSTLVICRLLKSRQTLSGTSLSSMDHPTSCPVQHPGPIRLKELTVGREKLSRDGRWFKMPSINDSPFMEMPVVRVGSENELDLLFDASLKLKCKCSPLPACISDVFGRNNAFMPCCLAQAVIVSRANKTSSAS